MLGTALAVASIGSTVLKGIGDYNQSKSNARAYGVQAGIQARNRAQDIQALASVQQMSFLNAGVELTGTPANVINDTYNTGFKDLDAIKAGFQTQLRNSLVQGRSSLLGNLGMAGVSGFNLYERLKQKNGSDSNGKTAIL